MVALPAVHGKAMVHCVGSAPGFFTGGCRWFLSKAGGVNLTPADLTAIASLFANSTTGPLAALKPMQSAAYTWQGITVTDLGGDAGQAIGTTSITGTVAGVCLPPQCSVALSWNITGRWRGGKPRTYVPAIPQSAQIADPGAALKATYQTTAETAAANFQTAVNALVLDSDAVQLGVISYFSKAANPTPPHLRSVPVFYPFANARVHGRLDSQRRRSGKESAFSPG